MKYLKWGLCIFIAFVFVQSLFFKFTGSPETTFIFGTLGEWSGLAWFGQYGAYMVGIAELIASILLFTRLHALGALMAVGTMTGAIFFHLFTPIGVAQPAFNEVGEVVGNDGGILFVMACLVWLSAAFLLYQSRNGDQELVD
ncbi:hypothetical protein [Enterovibrio norvegicus]|uniref:hypothetical protein n=1 Tax=Enterovibrio norvegicus TaxID=188144 RepID=UPI0035523664